MKYPTAIHFTALYIVSFIKLLYREKHFLNNGSTARCLIFKQTFSPDPFIKPP